MKKLKSFILLCTLIVTPSFVIAKALNMAFVDGNTIIEQYKEGIHESLQDEFASKREELNNLAKELKQLDSQLERDEAILSSKEVRQLKEKIANKQRQYQRASVAYNEDYTMRGKQALHELVEHIQSVVNKVAAERHFDIVLQRGAAVFVSNQFDITDEVLARLQKQEGGAVTNKKADEAVISKKAAS